MSELPPKGGRKALFCGSCYAHRIYSNYQFTVVVVAEDDNANDNQRS